MKNLLLSLLIFTSSFASAFEEELVLRGGIIAALTTMGTNLESNDDFGGYGLSSNFGYRFKNIELLLSSNAYIGKVENIRFGFHGETIQGAGKIRSVDFTPTFKYITPFKFYRNWALFMTAGPSWILHSIDLDHFTSGQEGFANTKLSYDARGGTLSLGMEEMTETKEMKPVYIQLLFSYFRSRKVSLVDISNSKEIQILSEEEAHQDIKTVTWMLNMGLVIF